ncbi:MAG: PH domain-containing protein [Actinomycetota bacterium]|nr:PH domain-containing protein [Actinomycetota bacterium]
MSSEARHLHPAAMLIDAIKTIRRWVSAFVIPGVALLASRGFSMRTITLILLGALVAAALAALWGFLSWRATTYEVSGGAFHLRQGVLQKNERTIPLEHVQSVDTVQGIIQRFFGIVEVRVETAGGGTSQPDASLPALDRADAEALRREIEGSRREPVEEAAGPAVLRRLGTRDLLIAGATSGQIGVAFSLIAVVSQLFDDLLSESLAQRLFEALTPRSVTAVLLLVGAFGAFAWLLAIGGTVLAYAGFTLSRDGDFLYVRRGLLERREATIPLARIQAVRIAEGLLRQPFGLATLRVESAGYGEDSGVSTTLFPVLPRKEAHELLLGAAPEFAVAPTLEHLPTRALRRYVLRATVPVLLLAIAGALVSYFAFDFAAWGFAALLLVFPAALYGWLCYRDAGWAYQGDRLVVRSRLLARTTAIAPRRRLQSRAVVRSPFQRRARLATFRAQVASGGGGAELQVTDLGANAAETLAEGLRPSAHRSKR